MPPVLMRVQCRHYFLIDEWLHSPYRPLLLPVYMADTEGLAIAHETVMYEGDEQPTQSGGWIIVHVDSGLRIHTGTLRTLYGARQAADALGEYFDWAVGLKELQADPIMMGQTQEIVDMCANMRAKEGDETQ